MRQFIFIVALLCASTSWAQTPTPTPDPEESLASGLNISVFELRASRLVQLLQELIAIKRAEREGSLPTLGELTTAQRQALRQKRIGARTKLSNFCQRLGKAD